MTINIYASDSNPKKLISSEIEQLELLAKETHAITVKSSLELTWAWTILKYLNICRIKHFLDTATRFENTGFW